jgi:hypothetical protein
MQNSQLPRAPGTDAGVSELIGAVLLITVVVAAVAIVGVILLSQSTPQEIPNVNFMTGSDNAGNLYLFHNGGDSLPLGTFSVIVDGSSPKSCSAGSTACQCPGCGADWSLGENLLIPAGTVGRHTVALIYNSTGAGGVVIRSGTANVVVSATQMPDVIAGFSYPPAISVSQLMQNITNNSINYYRERGTTAVITSGYLQFNVTGINSSMVYTPVDPVGPPLFVPLNAGSRVTITPLSPEIRVFAVGDQIWEFTSERSTLTIIGQNNTVNNLPVAINHTWVTGYKDLQSTLSFSGTSGTGYTELVVNNYPSYNRSQAFSGQVINSSTSQVVALNNIRPLATGLLVLRIDNRTNSTYFVGNATYAIA